MKLIDIIFESVVDMGEARKPMTQDEFIQRSNKIHNGKYTYGNVDYVNANTKVNITCPIHGDFSQTPSMHLSGQGCVKCSFDKKTSNTDDFIPKAQKKHRNVDGTPKYTYDNVNYSNQKTKVNITCPVHGDFSQTPKDHLSGGGCRYCQYDGIRSNTDDFILRAQSTHYYNDKNKTPKYTYDNVNYIGSNKKVIITCPIHGDFSQAPKSHLEGQGCPRCNESKGEKEMGRILYEKKIKVVTQKKYVDCVSQKSKNRLDKRCYKLEFDFYLPEYNTLVEFDGGYHFSGKMYDNQDYVSSILNDREKNRYTKVNGIKLIRIGLNDMKNIEQELMKGLDSNKQLYLSTNYPIGKGWRDKTIKV